jgi:CheY-like chemotaxis protein
MAHILFIDDDPLTLETLSRAVELLGHQPHVATSGEEAFILASDQKLDLIFVDMSLPDTEGDQMIAALRSREGTQQVPMFILSASPAIDAAERAERAGAQAYLNKPIRLQTLLEIINQYAPG